MSDRTSSRLLAVAAVPAPWGPVHVAVSASAVVAVEVLATRDAFVDRVERRQRARVADAIESPGLRDQLDRAVDQLEAFLAGDRRSFDVPLDLGPAPPWDRTVLGGVRDVPWGAVTSYGRVATRIGRRGAARAVGGAVGRNPIGLVIPCHRVIAGDGSIGGYGGDWFGTREELLAIKRELLEREGITLPARAFAD